MPIETYEDIPTASDDEVMEFLREQIHVILDVAGEKRRIIVAAFDEILNDVKRRLKKVRYPREQASIFLDGPSIN